MAAELPAELRDLVENLEQNGFSVVAERYDEAHFGNRFVELIDPSRDSGNAVRVVRDRGLWSVEILVGGKWRDPYKVVLALNGSAYSTRACSHEERHQLTLEALKRLPPAASLGPMVERLDEYDREYWRQHGVKDADLQ